MIIRTVKDKNNPYVIINKSFLDDPNISLAAKGLLTYCLSKPDGWKFYPRKMADVLKEGKDAIYRLFNELIENGYMMRKQAKTESGKFASNQYDLYETKLKESLPRPDFPDTETPDPAERDAPYIGIDIVNIDRVNNKSELPLGITNFFFNELKKINPELKKPNLDNWAREFDLMFRVDKRSEENIRKVIDFLVWTHSQPASSNGFKWSNAVLSAASFRKNYGQLWAQMQDLKDKKDYSKSGESEDRKLAEKIWNKCKGRPHQDIRLGAKYIEFINGVNAPSTVLEFGSKDFSNKCMEQLRKRNIDVNGL